MESHNTNSSLETLLIFDCDEAEKLDRYSSLDSYKRNYEERVQQKKHRRHYKSKREHRRKRYKKMETTNLCRTKLVTQEVHVEKQNFKCIINLNTTVCDHSIIHRTCNAALDTKSRIKRIVPQCMRQLCCQPRNHTRDLKHRKEKHTVDEHHQTIFIKEHETKDKKDDIRKCRHGKKISKRRKQKEPKQVPLNQFELEYEDISTTSLDSYMDIPTSYKHVKNPKVPESKLDTLIRRAKERERKRTFSWYKNPAYTEMSSMIFPINYSKGLLSRSTFILDTKEHGYSPPIEGLAPSPTFERYFQFSNIEESYDFELNIKAEPTMPIEAYSPTQRTDLKKEDQDILNRVKKEIKTEPKFEDT